MNEIGTAKNQEDASAKSGHEGSGPWDNERTWRQLFQRLPAAVYSCDADGRVIFFNPAAADLWGREPEIGRDLWCGSWRIFWPDGTPMPLDQCPMAICLRERRAVRDIGIIIERPDGARRHVMPHPEPIYAASGAFLGAFNLLLDITERKAADYARTMLAAIVQSSDDAIISKDLNGIITSWNRGAERVFGYPPGEAIGKPITILIPPDRIREEPHVMSRISRGESIEHYETIRRHKNGALIDISLTVSPIIDGRGKVIGASKIARDISDRKRSEKTMADADRRKDEFLATLAHELRNPLAPLKTSLEYLRKAGLCASPPQQVVEVMGRQVDHLVRLVDDLLEISRISRGSIELKKEMLQLGEVLMDAVETSRPLFEARGHHLEVSLIPDALTVMGDCVRLVQVFTNLLNNAAKFTPPQGTVWLTLERDEEHAVVRVADTGVGMPSEMLDAVFQMFTQVGKSPEGVSSGLGIGLSLVRRLLEMHGGSVHAQSAGLHLGSEFVVRIPLAVEAMELPKVHPTANSSVERAPCRVLVVDDNRDAAESMALLLKLLGHDVHVAYGGEEALVRAEALRPQVVLLDIGMPGMSGYDVAAELRKQPWGKSLRLIALTGWGQASDRERTAEAGFDHHLVKPVDFGTLEQILIAPLSSQMMH